MTIAVCWKCGEMKWGAFLPCPKCNAAPKGEEDMAVSLALTDHYFEKAELERMGAKIAAGTQMVLNPATRERIIKTLRGE